MGLFVGARGALAAALAILVSLAAAPDAAAQYFGRNKVEYDNSAFEVLPTAHFDIHYYPREREAVEIAARLAERWYARLSRVLQHEFNDRQPLILYGSHPDFAQTNVVSGFLDDGIAGVTESRRRRIVMPFGTALGVFDRVLGHEIVHAFQYDIARRHRGTAWVPLWFAEGMAEHLSIGPVDPLTAMWLRDAVTHATLPRIDELSRSRHSPYRFGHALWTYLAERFGDDVFARILKAGRADVVKRLERITGVDRATLTRDWHAAVKAASQTARPFHSSAPGGGGAPPLEKARALVTRARAGRFNFGPALSPDGRELVFFSEKDRVSIDLFLADAATGRVKRKLATTAANPRFESLQSVHSSGAWAPDGRHFAFAAVRQGRPVVTILDVPRRREDGAPRLEREVRELAFPQFGEVANPRWSPDGRALAFTALKGGFSDLYVYDMDNAGLRQFTADPYTDLQPAWSPDGTRLAFVTDRFATDLRSLRFGPLRIAIFDLATGAIEPLGVAQGFSLATKQIDPQWSPDGGSLYYVADPGGVSNVYRFDFDSGATAQITDMATGVTGLTALGPALAVASRAGTLAFSVLRASGFEIRTLSSDEAAAVRAPAASAFTYADRTTPSSSGDGQVAELLDDATFGLPMEEARPGRRYVPDLQLDAFGTPYVAFGSGRFGYLRGGTSFLLGDLLGERKLAAAVQLGTRLNDVALIARYLNRASRWNWGVAAELAPYVRGWSRTHEETDGAARLITREAEQLVQMHYKAEGLLAYPFSRTQRLELTAGVRHISYDRRLRSRVFLAPTRRLSTSSGRPERVEGRLVSEGESELPSADAVTIGEAAAALVTDTAVYGPTAPILGTRARFEITPSFGELTFTRVLLDYRRYLMPVKPYTIAARVMHIGRYGPDADDLRLLPHFLGFRHLVRGYDSTAFRECRATGTADCSALEALQGTRLAVANVEVRFPLLGVRRGEIRYGPLPVEGVVFVDAGLAWGGRARGPARGATAARSVGAAVRTNALGMILELGAVRAFDRLGGWGLSVNFRPGF